MIPKVFGESDEMLKRKVVTFLSDFLGMKERPLFIEIERYLRVLPQYETGHLERVARIEKKALRYPGLFFAGNGFRGFGITDCIRQARTAVSNLQLPVS
jgi:oxygen-dependent protoporphyrinogen oxidase